jgi:hypothetical protein
MGKEQAALTRSIGQVQGGMHPWHNCIHRIHRRYCVKGNPISVLGPIAGPELKRLSRGEPTKPARVTHSWGLYSHTPPPLPSLGGLRFTPLTPLLRRGSW